MAWATFSRVKWTLSAAYIKNVSKSYRISTHLFVTTKLQLHFIRRSDEGLKVAILRKSAHSAHVYLRRRHLDHNHCGLYRCSPLCVCVMVHAEKCPFLCEGIHAHSPSTWFLGLTSPCAQTVARSVLCWSTASTVSGLVVMTDRQTDKQTHTHRPRYICNNRPHLICSLVIASQCSICCY